MTTKTSTLYINTYLYSCVTTKASTHSINIHLYSCVTSNTSTPYIHIYLYRCVTTETSSNSINTSLNSYLLVAIYICTKIWVVSLLLMETLLIYGEETLIRLISRNTLQQLIMQILTIHQYLTDRCLAIQLHYH